MAGVLERLNRQTGVQSVLHSLDDLPNSGRRQARQMWREPAEAEERVEHLQVPPIAKERLEDSARILALLGIEWDTKETTLR